MIDPKRINTILVKKLTERFTTMQILLILKALKESIAESLTVPHEINTSKLQAPSLE